MSAKQTGIPLMLKQYKPVNKFYFTDKGFYIMPSTISFSNQRNVPVVIVKVPPGHGVPFFT